jgi:hypothetical protein
MAGLLALPAFASLPIRSEQWHITGKGFYSNQIIGIGITAAGPLLNLTGFPIKPFWHPNYL